MASQKAQFNKWIESLAQVAYHEHRYLKIGDLEAIMGRKADNLATLEAFYRYLFGDGKTYFRKCLRQLKAKQNSL